MTFLTEPQVRDIVARTLTPLRLAGQRVLLIVPDATRTAPVGLLFRTIYDLIGGDTKSLDIMIALGTHPPMSDEAINRRLEISAEERTGKYRRVRLLNHAWDDLAALLEKAAGTETDLEKKIALEKRVAGLHEQKRSDLKAAAAAWERVVTLVAYRTA